MGNVFQFSMFETVTTAIFDMFPETRKFKPVVVGVACAIMFVLALPMVSQSGIYWLTLLDTYSAGFSLMFISLFETICIVYIYGWSCFLISSRINIGPCFLFLQVPLVSYSTLRKK